MNTSKLVRLSALIAMAIVLSLVESALSPVVPVPGMKLGLANIVVMYTFLAFEMQSAFAVTLSKSLFVLSMRGAVSGILSLTGGFASLLVLIVINWITNRKASMVLLSVFGAVVHNLAQISVVTLIYDHFIAFFYIPLLVIAGVLAGMITAFLLHITHPIISKITKSEHRGEKL